MYRVDQAVEEEEGEEVVNLSACPATISKLIDRFGNRFIFGNAGDLWLPPLPIGRDNNYCSHLRRLREMDIRQDDILICSYPKTGLHWHMEIVSMLVSKDIRYTTPEDFAKTYLEMNTTFASPEVKGQPRIIHTHLPFRYLPKQVLTQRPKVLHLVRNPKDVLVSLYCQVSSLRPPTNYPGTFQQLVFLMLECGYHYGSIFEYLLGFQDAFEDNPQLPVMTSVFEEMKQDPLASVKAIDAFLGTGCSPEFCQQVASACQFKQVKEHKGDKADELEKRIFRSGSHGFYRKGAVGDWKNWFTVALNEVFDEEWARRMGQYKIKFQYE